MPISWRTRLSHSSLCLPHRILNPHFTAKTASASAGQRITKHQEKLRVSVQCLQSPPEVKRREVGGGEESIWRKEAERMDLPSPTLVGEQTSPSLLEQEFPLSGPSTFAPATHSIWRHPMIPSHPRPLDRTVATAAATAERKAKTCWQLGAEGLPGSRAKRK